jgi:aromatic-L-amino-acid/L-tryptophan decarboxylase
MTPDEFRILGRQMVDFIADYWQSVDQHPVLSRSAPGDILRALPTSPPQQGLANSTSPDPWHDIFQDLRSTILPGLTHWQHPSFFAYFPANISGPAVLGELLAAGLGVQGMLWLTSPACTELETRVLDWTAQILDLPAAFHSTSTDGSTTGGGVIHGTASEAVLVALITARDQARRRSPDSRPLIAYASDQTHSSFLKAAIIAGLADSPDDHRHLRLIETDSTGALRPDALESALRADLAAAHSAACPPADQPWLHVDAAYAGNALICPEFRSMAAGYAAADSFCFNPHKWLLTNFDCSCFFVKHRAALTNALSVTPEYLRNAASDAGTVIDYRDWQIPLGRRFRALKLWFVIRHFGINGLQSYIRSHIRLGQLFESLLRTDPRLEVVVPRTLNLVCFRLKPLPAESPADTDARNRTLMQQLNASGALFLTHATLPKSHPQGPRLFLRLVPGGTTTTETHIHQAWQNIQATSHPMPDA